MSGPAGFAGQNPGSYWQTARPPAASIRMLTSPIILGCGGGEMGRNRIRTAGVAAASAALAAGSLAATATAATTAGASTIDPRCRVGRVVCIDKSTRKLRWMVDGHVRLKMSARFG